MEQGHQDRGCELTAGGLLVFGVVFAGCVSAEVFAAGGGWGANRVLGLLLYGFFAGWVALMGRMLRTGLYVSDAAVRVRSAFRPATVPRRDVAEVEAVRGVDFGLPKDLLRLVNGQRFYTTVRRHVGQADRRAGDRPATDDFDRVAGILWGYLDRGVSA